MRFTDRSRASLEWVCPRAAMWQYHDGGWGLVPQEDDLDQAFGLEMAEQLALIKQGKAWGVAGFRALAKVPLSETRALATGLLTGYERLVWPRWLKDFDLVAIEQEMPKVLVVEGLTEGLTYNSRPDTVMRRKSDQTLWYGPEDKTTGWLDSLLHYAQDVQLHATGVCIEDHLGPVSGCMIQGLYKGFVKEGKLYHPLVWAYVKEGRAGIVPDQWSAKWVRGWERAEVAQYPGGVGAWLAKLTPEDLAGVFPNSPPVMLNRPLVASYFAQRVLREGEIARWHEHGRVGGDRDRLFPQHFSQCNEFSRSRKPCGFNALCFNPTVQRFPLSMFKRRVPHHDNERSVQDAGSQSSAE